MVPFSLPWMLSLPPQLVTQVIIEVRSVKYPLIVALIRCPGFANRDSMLGDLFISFAVTGIGVSFTVEGGGIGGVGLVSLEFGVPCCVGAIRLDFSISLWVYASCREGWFCSAVERVSSKRKALRVRHKLGWFLSL